MIGVNIKSLCINQYVIEILVFVAVMIKIIIYFN